MPKFPRQTLIIIPLCLFGWLFFSLPTASADIPKLTNPLDNLTIKIPGLTEIAKNYPVTCENKNGQDVCDIPWLGVYIAAIYQYAVGAVGVLAVIIMMVGGIIWITAGGNTNRVGEAKKWIGGAVSGLVLALASYLILYQINPNLVSFKLLKIAMVNPGKKLTSLQCEWKIASNCAEAGTDWTQGEKDDCNEGKDFKITGEDNETICCCKEIKSGGGNCDKSKYSVDQNNRINFETSEKLPVSPTCDQYDSFFNQGSSYKFILKAIAMQESGCNPGAQSSAGACGLMQLKPDVAKIYNPQGADCGWLKNHPAESVNIAEQYIRANDSTHNRSLSLIFAGYNSGYGTSGSGGLAPSQDCPGIKKFECCINPQELAETQDYVYKAVRYYNYLK